MSDGAGNSAANANDRRGSDDEWWVRLTNQLATVRDTMTEKARHVQGQLTDKDMQHAVVTSTVGTIGYAHTPFYCLISILIVMLPSHVSEIPVIDRSSWRTEPTAVRSPNTLSSADTCVHLPRSDRARVNALAVVAIPSVNTIPCVSLCIESHVNVHD